MIRLEKCKKVHNFKRNKDTDYKRNSYPWVLNPNSSIAIIGSMIDLL